MRASRYFVTPYSTPPSAPGAAPTSRRYRYDLFAPASALPGAPHVLLLHGFPDAGSLRGVASALAFAGFTAVLPDMLGYGRTSKPPQTRIAEYGPHAMVNDLLALMESLVGQQRFVVVGHDWGSFLAWRFALHAPQRVLGIAGISVPYVPQPSQTQFLPFERLLQVVPSFGYQAFFAEPRSSALIEPRIDDFLSMIFAAPRAMRTEAARTYEWNAAGTLERMLQQPLAPETLADFKQAALLRGEDWERVLDCFDPKRGGSIDAPLNWYRCRRIAWEEERTLASLKLPQMPYLLLMSTHDAALPAQMGAAMPKHAPAGTLRTAVAQGCGHWPHLEQPNWVAQQIRAWLEEEVGVGRAGKM